MIISDVFAIQKEWDQQQRVLRIQFESDALNLIPRNKAEQTFFPIRVKIPQDHRSSKFETMLKFHQNVSDRWMMILEAKNSKQSCEMVQRARCAQTPPSSLLLQWHQLTRSTIIKPGLLPWSKLLFGDKSILQSQADGHLAHCNCSLSLVSLWRAAPTDVELHQTCRLTRTAGRTKRGSDGQPGILESSPPVVLCNYL